MQDDSKLCCWCDDEATTYVEYGDAKHICCEKHYYEHRMPNDITFTIDEQSDRSFVVKVS